MTTYLPLKGCHIHLVGSSFLPANAPVPSVKKVDLLAHTSWHFLCGYHMQLPNIIFSCPSNNARPQLERRLRLVL